MAFHDVLIPAGFQYGSAFGPGFATIVQETASGHETRVTRRAQGRHRLTLRKELQSNIEAAALKSFALERRGSLHSFKVSDVSDFTTHPDGTGAHTLVDAALGSGDGTNKTFQLLKIYGVGGPNPYARALTLPVGGTVLVALDTIATTAFSLAGDGKITFDTAPANGVVVTAGCQFYVPVRFGLSFDQWAALQADAFNNWSLPQLDVVEVLNEVENPERRPPDGGRDWGALATSFRVAFNDGKVQRVNPSVAISMVLPSPAPWTPGGHEVFVVAVASGAAGSVQVRDDAGNAVGAAITAGQYRMLDLVIGASTASWVLG